MSSTQALDARQRSERAAGSSKAPGVTYIQYLKRRLRLRLALIPVRFLRFCLVGFSGVAIDMSLLWLFSERLGWPLTASKMASCEAAILNNFFWNDRWTFRDLRTGSTMRRLATFNAVCLGGLGLSVALLDVQVLWFGFNRYFANGLAVLLVTGWNFGMNRLFAWRPVQRVSSGRTARAA